MPHVRGHENGEREVFEAHANVMRVLSSPVRHEIFHRIVEAPSTVTSLVAATGASKAAVSQHVSALRACGLVRAERTGRSVMFTATYPELAEACALIDRVLADQASRTTRLLDRTDAL